MKISIISGSHRNPSQSYKVAQYIQATLTQDDSITANIINLADNPFPLWDQSIWDGDEQWEKILAPTRQQLDESDAFVVIAPEWHGQVPAGLKNFFLLFGKNELGHKPALITAVSSADGGAYCVAELRMSSYKNNRLCYIPEQLVLRNVENILNDKAEDNDQEADGYFRERITWTLNILKEYANALQSVRSSGCVEYSKFGNGM